MAHIKRFDALTQLAAQLAVAIFWFDPLIWLAAHRMRVEREHACDDYVLRDGTKPSLYAGELLDMVRSLGTPEHERAAPAFAALAMARRSEFEGRMLAILDPKLDRHNLDRRSTLLTAAAVALLVLPLAALRPFEQPGFKNPATQLASNKTGAVVPAAETKTSYTCDSADLGRTGSTSTHISINEDLEAGIRNLSYMVSAPGRCAEARMVGIARLSGDETRLVALPPGGVLRLREVLPGSDRSLVAVAESNGAPSYVMRVGGKPVDFDAGMQAWVSKLMPEIMREAAIDVPQRVARLRREGGVDNVLDAIARIQSNAAQAAHYTALLKADNFTQAEIDRIARAAGRDLASTPSDLRSVLDLMKSQRPSNSAQAAIGQSVQTAIRKAKSSGDKASILTQYAVGGDSDAVLMALRGAKELSSDGDKSTLLKTLAASALNGRNPALRRAFFDAFETLSSDGDSRSVLTAALPYGHANPAVTLDVIQATRHISSDTDKAEVLIALTKQRLLTSAAIRTAFLDAAKGISSSSDQRRVLQAVAEQ